MAKTQKVVGAIHHAVIPVSSLSAHPRNYRQHPEMQVARLQASIARFGQVRSIVVQEGADGNYLIVAGHGLVQAAVTKGLEELRADVIPATWTAEQVEGYLVADNETARGSFDDEVLLAKILQEQKAAGQDLESLGYSDGELDELLERLAGTAGKRAIDDPDGGGDDFDTEPEQGETRCKSGDLWHLGEHRLLCGDSTDAADVMDLLEGEHVVLLATDPPYNVGKNYGEDVDDAKSAAEYERFTRGWFTVWSEVSDRQIVTPGCYNLARWLRWFDAYHWAPWTKTNAMTNGKVSRWWCWEPILFFGEKWKRTRPNDVFDFPAGQHKDTGGHPCPKPLKMWADLMVNYSDAGDVVADAFGGSGTAVIAAERTDRICYVLEIEPRYCDVILRRWEAETGKTATLAHRGEQEVA